MIRQHTFSTLCRSFIKGSTWHPSSHRRLWYMLHSWKCWLIRTPNHGFKRTVAIRWHKKKHAQKHNVNPNTNGTFSVVRVAADARRVNHRPAQLTNKFIGLPHASGIVSTSRVLPTVMVHVSCRTPAKLLCYCRFIPSGVPTTQHPKLQPCITRPLVETCTRDQWLFQTLFRTPYSKRRTQK